jgi:hypothetical protein
MCLLRFHNSAEVLSGRCARPEGRRKISLE